MSSGGSGLAQQTALWIFCRRRALNVKGQNLVLALILGAKPELCRTPGGSGVLGHPWGTVAVPG